MRLAVETRQAREAFEAAREAAATEEPWTYPPGTRMVEWEYRAIRLAVFMGWEDGSAYRDIIGVPVVTLWKVRYASTRMHMDEVFIYSHTGGVEPWHPLLNPSQSARVMVEAVRRGWFVETSCDPMSSFSKPHTKAQVQTSESAKSGKGWFAVEDGVTPESWCRAVCRAVLYTLDAIEREAAITPQERLERSV